MLRDFGIRLHTVRRALYDRGITCGTSFFWAFPLLMSSVPRLKPISRKHVGFTSPTDKFHGLSDTIAKNVVEHEWDAGYSSSLEELRQPKIFRPKNGIKY